jgi:hypothetical protein
MTNRFGIYLCQGSCRRKEFVGRAIGHGGFHLFSWAFAAYLLPQAVTIPIYGRPADLYGRKCRLLRWGGASGSRLTPFFYKLAGTDGLQTLCWRKSDSNSWSHVGRRAGKDQRIVQPS